MLRFRLSDQYAKKLWRCGVSYFLVTMAIARQFVLRSSATCRTVFPLFPYIYIYIYFALLDLACYVSKKPNSFAKSGWRRNTPWFKGYSESCTYQVSIIWTHKGDTAAIKSPSFSFPINNSQVTQQPLYLPRLLLASVPCFPFFPFPSCSLASMPFEIGCCNRRYKYLTAIHFCNCEAFTLSRPVSPS